jgi:hypothetical protein
MKPRGKSLKDIPITSTETFAYENAVLILESNCAVILYKNGQIYIGQVAGDHLPDGSGILFLPFCGFFLGNFERGKLEGSAVFKEPNSNFGLMNFRNGIFEGKAVKFRWDSEDTSREMYHNGALRVREGRSKIFFDGQSYPDEFETITKIEEAFLDAIVDCSVIEVLSNHEFTYLGATKKNLPEGIGIKFSRNFEIEAGIFSQGKLSGFGRRIRRNCDMSIGNFKDGRESGESCNFEAASSSWFSCNHVTNKIEKISLPSADTFPNIDFDILSCGLKITRDRFFPDKTLEENLVLFRADKLHRFRRSFLAFQNYFHPDLLRQGFEDFTFNFFYPCSESFLKVDKSKLKRKQQLARSSLKRSSVRKPASAQKTTAVETSNRPTAPLNFRRSLKRSVVEKPTALNQTQTLTVDPFFKRSTVQSKRPGSFLELEKSKPKQVAPTINLVDYYLNQFNKSQAQHGGAKSGGRPQKDNAPSQVTNMFSTISIYTPMSRRNQVRTMNSIGKSRFGSPSNNKQPRDPMLSNQKPSAKEGAVENIASSGQLDMDKYAEPEPQVRTLTVQMTPSQNKKGAINLRNVQSMDILDRQEMVSIPKLLSSKERFNSADFNPLHKNSLAEGESAKDSRYGDATPLHRPIDFSHNFRLNEETINFTEHPSYNFRETEVGQNSSNVTDDIILTNREEGFMTYYKAIRDESKDVYLYETIDDNNNDNYSRSQKSIFFALSQKIANRKVI